MKKGVFSVVLLAMFVVGCASSVGAETGTTGGDTAGRSSTRSSNRVYKIGDTGPAGGIIFFDMGFYMDGWRYLEAAPQDFHMKVRWGQGSLRGTDTILGSGKKNTELIISEFGKETLGAAQVGKRDATKYRGYDDWFLPSRDELNIMYQNRTIIGGFNSGWYWSSSCTGNSTYAWGQSFSNGDQGFPYGYRGETVIGNANSVRVIRQF
ncbi:hypothetical protein FACS1894172_21130 [Spirochaetia bacterium]|nr:hypothetical protein FACS1894172_21130 [Spirochaetia bacterium]